MHFFDRKQMSDDFPEDHLVKTKILGVSGTPRRGGNSDVLLKSILKGAESEGVPTEAVYLRNYKYDPCIGCEKCRKDKICTGLNDGMTLLYPKFIESRGLVLTSPIHWYYVSGLMKCFMDRLYCFFDWPHGRKGDGIWKCRLANQKRKMVFSIVCEQDTNKGFGTTSETVRHCMSDCTYDVVDELLVKSAFSVGEIKKMQHVLDSAFKLGVKLALSLQ